jgi:hypothetical protein
MVKGSMDPPDPPAPMPLNQLITEDDWLRLRNLEGFDPFESWADLFSSGRSVFGFGGVGGEVARRLGNSNLSRKELSVTLSS